MSNICLKTSQHYLFTRTLAGVATPLKGDVSSEMLYLVHTRSGIFQVTVNGWCSNSGPAVWGSWAGARREVVTSRGGRCDFLERAGGVVLKVNAAERGDIKRGEKSFFKAL